MGGLGWNAAEGVLSPATVRQQPELHALFAKLWEEYDAQTYVEQVEALLASSTWDLLPQVTVPSLIMAGKDDAYAPPDEIDRFAAGIPNLIQRIEIPDCGHMSFLEKPEVFAEAVAGFLNGRP
jgi:pimeloyl-ACP methyl ester carboxylesterase